MLHDTQASILTFLFNYILPQGLEKEMAPYSSVLAWKIHGQRSLVGYSRWGCKELDMTQRLSTPQGPSHPNSCFSLSLPPSKHSQTAMMTILTSTAPTSFMGKVKKALLCDSITPLKGEAKAGEVVCLCHTSRSCSAVQQGTWKLI